MTDEELFERFRDTHDNEAFGELYRRNQQAIERYLSRFVKGDSEDVAQKLWGKILDSQPPAIRNFKAWLHFMAEQVAIDHLRMAKCEERRIDVYRDRPPRTAYPFDSIAEITHRMSTLPDGEQRVVRLILEGKSPKAIALAEGEKRSTFYARLSRIAEKLRRVLGD